MTALLMTILCSTSIALILKHNDSRSGEPLVLLSGNYLIAGLVGGMILVRDSHAAYSVQTFLFGGALGLLFVLSFFAFARAVRAAGTAMAAVSSRLSVVIPLILSILFFNEIPGTMQFMGFGFALLTIYFFYRSLRANTGKILICKDYLYLLGVLAGIGINDFLMNVFRQWRPNAEKPFFLFIIFTSAFIYTALFIRVRRIPVRTDTFLLGGILGIPNLFSSFFLLSALAVLPGIVVYPAANIGIILLTALGALLIWGERLNKAGVMALLSGILSIMLLTL